MVIMKWTKDAAGRVVFTWNTVGKEAAPKKLVFRYRKAPKTTGKTEPVPAPEPTLTQTH